MATIQSITTVAEFGALLFSVSRTDDVEWLRELREGIDERLDLDDQDKFDLNAAIDLRFSQLNALALQNAGPRWNARQLNPSSN